MTSLFINWFFEKIWSDNPLVFLGKVVIFMLLSPAVLVLIIVFCIYDIIYNKDI